MGFVTAEGPGEKAPRRRERLLFELWTSRGRKWLCTESPDGDVLRFKSEDGITYLAVQGDTLLGVAEQLRELEQLLGRHARLVEIVKQRGETK